VAGKGLPQHNRTWLIAFDGLAGLRPPIEASWQISSAQQIMSDDAGICLTIGDLALGGARLGLYCAACGRFRYVKTGRLPEDQNVKALADGLSCMRCGLNDVATRPVHRDIRTGRWPADGG
jgi:hypothetical protein